MFDPWSGKIPLATGQLSLCPTPTEARVLPSHCDEDPAQPEEVNENKLKKKRTVGEWGAINQYGN